MEQVYHSGKSCLSTLSPKEIEALFASSNSLEFEKGEIVVKKGSPVDNIYFLKDGIVELSLDQSTQNQTLNLLFAGQFIGINCVYSASSYRFSARAITNCTIEIFNRETFSKYLQTNTEFAMAFIQYISMMNESLLTWHMTLKEKNSAGALAYLLCEFEKSLGKSTFELPLTRQDVARIIGFSKESVLKNLADFRKEGILETTGKLTCILDSKRLQEIAKHG